MSVENVYSPAEVCHRFSISKSTLYRWETEGHIPAPDRDIRGARQYTQKHYEAIARFVQSRRHRQRFAQIVAKDVEDKRAKLEEFGERNALFKFVNLRDPTGLLELREYSPLEPSTIRELLRTALEDYHPDQDQFWAIIALLHETSYSKNRPLSDF